MNKLPKKTPKKIPMASNRLRILRDISGLLYFCAVSNKTIAMASFRIDSPNMTVYSFGSTLYTLKIARIVTGSVADRVAPVEMASMKEILSPSRGTRVQTHSIRPRETAEIKVPAKANVNMDPILRKKFACVRQFIIHLLPHLCSYLVELVT